MADNSKLEIFKLISKRYTFREVAILKCGLGGVAIAVLPYVIHPKTAVLGRAGGGAKNRCYVH